MQDTKLKSPTWAKVVAGGKTSTPKVDTKQTLHQGNDKENLHSEPPQARSYLRPHQVIRSCSSTSSDPPSSLFHIVKSVSPILQSSNSHRFWQGLSGFVTVEASTSRSCNGAEETPRGQHRSWTTIENRVPCPWAFRCRRPTDASKCPNCWQQRQRSHVWILHPHAERYGWESNKLQSRRWCRIVMQEEMHLRMNYFDLPRCR